MRLLPILFLFALANTALSWSFAEAFKEVVTDLTTCKKHFSPFYIIQSAFAPNITAPLVWSLIGNFTDNSAGLFTKVTGHDNTAGVRRYFQGYQGLQYEELIVEYGSSRAPSATQELFLQIYLNSDSVAPGVMYTGVKSVVAVANATNGMPGITFTWVTGGCANVSALGAAVFESVHAPIVDFYVALFANVSHALGH